MPDMRVLAPKSLKDRIGDVVFCCANVYAANVTPFVLSCKPDNDLYRVL
jgi:hypothetical protein